MYNKPVELDPNSFNRPKGMKRYSHKLLKQGAKYYKTITIKNNMSYQDNCGLTNPGTRSFALFSAYGNTLNIESEYFDWKMKLVLEGMAWLDPKEYIPFLETAEVGDMIILKGIIALVRLRYPKDSEDSAVWNIKSKDHETLPG